jgi:hypothetical protein
MATVLTNAGLYIGGYELTRYFNSISIDADADTADVTAFGATSREFQIGLKGARYAAAGFFNPLLSDKPLFDAWGNVDQVFTCASTNADAGVAFLMQGLVAQYGFGANIGQAATLTTSGQTSTGPLVRGVILHRTATAAATGAATHQTLGAVSATQSIYAALHVFSVAGTDTPTLTAIIESDADGNFASGATTRLSFTAATAIGAEWKQAGPAAITDTHWRVSYTISGTNPVFGFAVSFGIL